VKSKLTRIWGIALTLVLLIGLLVPVSATPVAAAATPLQYTNVNLPNGTTNFQLLPNLSASVYDVAADGKTMFAYTAGTTLTAGVPVGAVSITVANTSGFPASGTLLIGTESVAYSAIVGNTITTSALTAAHAAYDAVGLAGTLQLYKSADGGNTWTKTNMGGGTPPLNGTNVIKLVISPQYATDTTVMALTPSSIWRTIDGGQTWGIISNPAGFAGIYTDIAVSQYYSGGQAILVGWSTGVGTGGGAIYTTTTLGWAPFASQPNWITGDVIGVAFSPNHVSDAEFMAAVSFGPAGAAPLPDATHAGKTYLRFKLGGNNWNNDVLESPLTSDSTPGDTAPAAGNIATFAFPSDYDWSGNNRIFVGLGNTTGAVTPGLDVYRVNATLQTGAANATSRSYDLNANGSGTANATNISSVAFKGPLATGTLVVGQYPASAGMTILRSTNAVNNTPDWFQSTNNPIGAFNPVLKFSPTSSTLFCGTSGAHSALSTSTDYNNFSAYSLISVRSMDYVRATWISTIDANTWFIVMRDQVSASTATVGDFQMVFKTTNGGTSWQMVWSHTTQGGETLNQIFNSPTYATDSTIYITQTDYRIWKSTDGGASWTGYTSPNNATINAFTLVDANTYFVGSTAGIYKVGNYTAATIEGHVPNFLMYVDASNFFVGTTDGYVYMSTDNGSTWTKVGGDPSVETPGGKVWLTRDAGYATNKIIYADNQANGNVYRFTVGTSATFEKINNAPLGATSGTAYAIGGITRTADNSLYVSAGPADTGKNVVCWRNPNPTVQLSEQVWEPMGPVTATDAPGYTFNNGVTGWPVGAVNQNNKIFNSSTASEPSNTLVVIAKGVTNPISTTNGYNYQLVTLKDTLVTAPAVVAPKANAQVNQQSTFQWTPLASPVTLTYEVQIATDDKFQGLIVDKQTSASSYYTTANDGLVQGNKYFWRVFVAPAGTANTNPWSSKKPAAVPFVIKLGTVGNSLEGASGNRIAPQAGATNVPLRPTFEWAPIQGADSYELELADNPFFANSQAKKPLQNTVWTWDKDLTPNTTYYWRIRAVAAGNASDWVSSVFTTGGGAAATGTPTAAPTVTVTQTPSPAPKFFDPNSGLYFNSQQELQQYQAAHPAGAAQPAPATPAYIWVIIAIGAILVIAVVVLIARTRRV